MVKRNEKQERDRTRRNFGPRDQVIRIVINAASLCDSLLSFRYFPAAYIPVTVRKISMRFDFPVSAATMQNVFIKKQGKIIQQTVNVISLALATTKIKR